ncbi:MAG: hypothetical protein IJ390_09540 [Lachnospiraceae bacterium]|nr:hypothetical protein [Lachnospiraceae bacterium]
MLENFLISLEILWKGMLGIFVASIIIWLAVVIMEKVTSDKKTNKESEQK